MEPADRSDEISASQHGVISRAQALTAGMTERAIDRRIATGHWKRVHAGVYRVSPFRTSWHQRLAALVLFGGPAALASHRSAARLWGLDGTEGRPLEISVKTGRRIRGAIVHRRGSNDDPPVRLLDGIRATAIERTLIDLAAVASPRSAGLALDDALRRNLTTLERVGTELAAAKGRAGTRALRQLLSLRDDRDAILESSLEAALLRLIRGHRLPLPVPQYPVGDGDELVARLDFAYPTHLLGIETDGYRWHASRDRWRADMRRENRLKLLGWTLLRFSWEDIHNQPGTVAEHIRAALCRSRSDLSTVPTASVGEVENPS